MENQIFCVISHTHWDREWSMPLEQFKIRLVDMVDHLLEILNEYPEYVFHLDAQTIVLEDYLSVRPDKRETLEKYIKAGNIIVGPWYMQNDFYLTSGESTIRNLKIGMKIAESFGNCAKIGYAPDQFGIIGQLPQILNGFGIKNFLFGRGFSLYEKDEKGNIVRVPYPTEFSFETASGAKVLAVHLALWYNNAQRFPDDVEKGKLILDINGGYFKTVSKVPYVLLMNGVDILEAQDDIIPVLKRLADYSRQEVKQVSMTDYFDKVRKYIDENGITLPSVVRELRQGGDYEILRGCYSSRIYLKRANVQAQTCLENTCEPMYSVLYQNGIDAYDKQYFEYVWKILLSNHPHDSICGCSADGVHRNMEDRYLRIKHITDTMSERAFDLAAYHYDVSKDDINNYVISLFNGNDEAYNGVIETKLTFLESDGVKAFSIENEKGEEVPFSVVKSYPDHKVVFTPLNLPGILNVDAYDIVIPNASVAQMSYQGLVVKKRDAFPDYVVSPAPVESFENEFIRVDFAGSDISVTDKKSGKTYERALYFQDEADRGDSYVYEPTDDCELTFSPAINGYEWVEKNEYVQSVKLYSDVTLPSEYDFEKDCRTAEKVITRVELLLRLKKGCEYLEVNYRFKNVAKDHRFRLCIKMPHGEEFITDSAFEYVRHKNSDNSIIAKSNNFCNATFIAKAGNSSLAVLTEGQHDCEQISDDVTALTLVRSTGMISRTGDHKAMGGKIWEVPENQCVREIEGRIAILPFTGENFAHVYKQGKLFRNGIITSFHSVDPKHLTGGRFAVQDSKLAELYMPKDKYADKRVTRNKPAFTVDAESVVCSAFKCVDDGDGSLVRLVNFSEKDAVATFKAKGDIYESNLSELNDGFIGNGSVKLSFRPFEIKTLKVLKVSR